MMVWSATCSINKGKGYTKVHQDSRTIEYFSFMHWPLKLKLSNANKCKPLGYANGKCIMISSPREAGKTSSLKTIQSGDNRRTRDTLNTSVRGTRVTGIGGASWFGSV